MEIRPLRREDRDAVRRIVSETGAFKPHEVDVCMELADIALNRPDQKDYHFFCAAGEAGVSGLICYGPNAIGEDVWTVYWMAVDPRLQRGGVGRKLMAFMESRILPGARLCVIDTSSTPAYDAARAFYARCGFAEAARLRDFYRPGDDLVIYRKDYR